MLFNSWMVFVAFGGAVPLLCHEVIQFSAYHLMNSWNICNTHRYKIVTSSKFKFGAKPWLELALLFNSSLNVRKLIKTKTTFPSLCCAVQKTIVDIAFVLGNSKFSTYEQFFTWIEYQNWQAASDFLNATKWCQVEDSARCHLDADNLLFQGCPCFGQFPNKCYDTVSSCCQEDQSCCNGKLFNICGDTWW
jgi:hypothetical protein